MEIAAAPFICSYPHLSVSHIQSQHSSTSKAGQRWIVVPHPNQWCSFPEPFNSNILSSCLHDCDLYSSAKNSLLSMWYVINPYPDLICTIPFHEFDQFLCILHIILQMLTLLGWLRSLTGAKFQEIDHPITGIAPIHWMFLQSFMGHGLCSRTGSGLTLLWFGHWI